METCIPSKSCTRCKGPNLTELKRCRECNDKISSYRDQNRDRVNAIQRTYEKNHPGQGNSWKLNNPEKYARHSKEYALRKSYGISIEDKVKMLESQDGVCAMPSCGIDITGVYPSGKEKACVDHCHTTGRIRGLLCMKHNTALGCLGDNEAGLINALEYVCKTKIWSDE